MVKERWTIWSQGRVHVLLCYKRLEGVNRYLRAARKEVSRHVFLFVCASMSLGRDRIKFHQERLSRMQLGGHMDLVVHTETSFSIVFS